MSPIRQIFEESEEEVFLKTKIHGILTPKLPLLSTNVKIAQKLWNVKGCDLVRNPKEIQYKSAQWHNKLVTEQSFKFRDLENFGVMLGIYQNK
ncbi:MAG: hypothetical protein EZS28_018214 [Streblomastix strix]|uniref:Uncharacterized protein n=1 Tax=Streblomastix strix TaxID=222440 RepID=A0A5J4VVI6_9EUKA|nr:MAG: hypothetical protein EZS28_018214 [Streblomastix strix]